MLTILLQPESDTPLYQQICLAIQEKIAQGNLAPMERLPSKRALATHLQVSVITVQTAYEQLVAEGYLITKPRAGYFVDENAALLTHVVDTKPSTRSIPTHPQEKPSSRQIAFSTAGVDLSQFPFSTWAKLSRQILSTRQEALLTATPTMGLYSLRQAIATHLRDFRGIVVSPDQILIGAGTEYLLSILVQLLGASRRYAVENPGYPKGKQTIKSNGASVIGIPLDDSGMDVEALEQSGASVALVTPSHQFPTGMVMPIHKRVQLLQWASRQPKRYLIEDDYDNELRFQGKPLPSFYQLDHEKTHILYMNTFARTLAPSLRIGYVVLPEALATQFSETFSFYSSTVPSFEQYTLEQFLQKGYFERHLRRMKKTYSGRQQLLKSAILSHPFSKYIRICGEEAGLHFLLEITLPCSEKQLVLAAKEADILVTGMSGFYEHGTKPTSSFPRIILGYAQLSEEEIQTGVKRLLDAWSQLLKKNLF
jgi:GntR family transcriptional regulator/MocR family aminotransferase